jgi:spore coat polysaccharide biosynthesis predicted glycosyltransferase SpsG
LLHSYNAAVAGVLLLTRGGGSFGLGHCYRSRWLAATLREQPWCVDVEIVSCGDTGEFWADSPVPVTRAATWQAAYDHAAASSVDMLIFDWLDSLAYAIGQLTERKRVVLLDDYGHAPLEAHLTINALLAPLEAGEQATKRGRILSGAQWVQLSPYTTKLRGVATATANAMSTELATPLPTLPGPVYSILVSVGDQGPRTTDLVQALLDALATRGCTSRVNLMPAPSGIAAPAGLDVALLPRGDGLPDLLAASDLVVCHDGLTLYEAAFLGIPAVVVPLWDTGAKLQRAGCCMTVAKGLDPLAGGTAAAAQVASLSADAAARGRMSAAGLRLLDGRGLQRTVEAIGALAIQ